MAFLKIAAIVAATVVALHFVFAMPILTLFGGLGVFIVLMRIEAAPRLKAREAARLEARKQGGAGYYDRGHAAMARRRASHDENLGPNVRPPESAALSTREINRDAGEVLRGLKSATEFAQDVDSQRDERD